MELRELGRTGEMIPEIGLGTAQYSGGDGPLRKGISLGATHIDTAEVYGTEEAVGHAIRGVRDQVFLTTKVSPTNFRHDDVINAADGSLRRLGTDRIDLYLLHWPSPDIPIGETMSAMDRLLEGGKVRYIGVSNFSVAQLEEAQSLTANPIVTNQVKYSLTAREVEVDLLPYCQENGVTLTAYSPLSTVLRKTGARMSKALSRVAKAAGKTEAQVAINWCTSKDEVIAIPRSSSLERTIENCGASGWRLSPDQIAELDAAA